MATNIKDITKYRRQFSNFISLDLSAFYQVTSSSILKTLSSLRFYDSLLAAPSKSSFFALNASALQYITIDTLMTIKFLASVQISEFQTHASNYLLGIPQVPLNKFPKFNSTPFTFFPHFLAKRHSNVGVLCGFWSLERPWF